MNTYTIKPLEYIIVGDDFHIENRLFNAYIFKDVAAGYYSLWFGENLMYDGLSLENAVEIVTDHYHSLLSDFLIKVK